MSTAKTGTPQTCRDRVAAYFEARPHVWIDGIALESIGGRYAWRTRVSECRRELGMDIRNRKRRQTDLQGRTWTTSEYQYVPARAIVSESRGHDLNAPIEGRLI